MLRISDKYRINRFVKIIGITFLISLFFVAPIVYALSVYTEVLEEDALAKVLNTTMQEEEEEEEDLVDSDEIQYLYTEPLIEHFTDLKSYNREIKKINISLFDPDLFIPPPKVYCS